MLEIIVVIALGRKLGEMAEQRGHGKGWIALVLLWFVGELLGGIVGFLVMGDEGLAPYLFALVGAALGGGAAYAIVANLAPKPGSMLDMDGGSEVYSHADPNNPYSPSGFGQNNNGPS